MNVYLEQCEEYYNGQILNRFADVFIRGNNGKNNIIINLVFYINSATTKNK
jgi:hypothetical protein